MAYNHRWTFTCHSFSHWIWKPALRRTWASQNVIFLLQYLNESMLEWLLSSTQSLCWWAACIFSTDFCLIISLGSSQSLVPLGSVEELLAVYDLKRRELQSPVMVWEWGWTRSAETWNGRAAMLAVLVLLVLEVTTGQGFLHQWGILPFFHWTTANKTFPTSIKRTMPSVNFVTEIDMLNSLCIIYIYTC
jgi:hypothetical protein